MKHKKKEKLLIDKKECSNCGHILEKKTMVCDECGYDMSMEETFKIYTKELRKILNENIQVVTLDKATGKASSPTQVDPKSLPVNTVIRVVDSRRAGNADESKKIKSKKKKPNPWAICTSSVGREDKEKYEKCVMDIKKEYKLHEDLTRLEEYIERIITDSEINPKIKKGNFKEFVSKIRK